MNKYHYGPEEDDNEEEESDGPEDEFPDPDL